MQPSVLLRSGRSAWKGPFFVAFPNIREALANNTPIKTDARSCTILPNFVGYVFRFEFCCFREGEIGGCLNLTSLRRIRFLVHNGKDYLPVTVTQDMVGHKLGEFSHTKKRFVYKCVYLFVLSEKVIADMVLSGTHRHTKNK
ncbi:hypothetical protein BJV78DRAFT_1398344 [Lactifluus subvellereus]|nr:hypothetical protein BJV78DRAFT_1398344 [Lactifluus subvellereus]